MKPIKRESIINKRSIIFVLFMFIIFHLLAQIWRQNQFSNLNIDNMSLKNELKHLNNKLIILRMKNENLQGFRRLEKLAKKYQMVYLGVPEFVY